MKKKTSSTSIARGAAVFGALKEMVLDIFFPRTCVHCGDPVEDSGYQYLCRSCARELFVVRPPACSTCGFPFFGAVAGPRECPHCAELEQDFDEGKTLFLAKGPGRSIVHQLKYHGGFYVFHDVARMIEQSADYRDYMYGSTLVPVPLHPAKLRERGYNQSEQIARFLAKQAVNSGVEILLERVEFTKTQTRLNREERHRNVKNAFALAPDAVVIADQQYILVDDVFTTGSTLNACSVVLREAGAQRIKVVTLGHG